MPVMMSRNPGLQQTYHRFNVQTPASCEDHSEKTRNLLRQIESVKSRTDEFVRTAERLELLNKGVLIAGLIKETCYSFLDLAGSIGGAVLPGPLGDRVENAAVAGKALIDLSAAGSNVIAGQGSMADFSVVAGRSMAALAGTPAVQSRLPSLSSPVGKQGLHAANQVSNSYDAFNGNESQSNLALRSMGYDEVNHVIDIAAEGPNPAATKLKAVVNTVKAVDRYSVALESTFNSYLNEAQSNAEWKASMKVNFERELRSLEKSLRSALVDLNSCLTQSPAITRP